MMQWLFFMFFIGIFVTTNVNALTMSVQKKFSYVLLTNDYGILRENDLAAYTWGMKPRPFLVNEDSGGYNYWQCFPRNIVTITLRDEGYSAEEFGWKDTLAELKIEVRIKPGTIHRYEMRAVRLVHDYEKRFHYWHKLMKGEKYVCLAGSFGRREQKRENGIDLSVYSWTFDKIRTKKGCDSYWGDCNRTYADYLKDEEKLTQWKKTGVWHN